MTDQSNILRHPQRTPMIFPSILGADFSCMGDECEDVLRLGADGLHLDVMDGHFVPNLTMGPDMARRLSRRFVDAYLDIHLMVEQPHRFVEPFAESGAGNLTFHIEATDLPGAIDLIGQIHDAGCQAGIALNPDTPASAVTALLTKVDMIVVMSVHPGFAGQSFLTQVLSKARELRDAAPTTTRIQIDGGVNAVNAAACRDAGCDVIVSASALFGANDRPAVMTALRGSQT